MVSTVTGRSASPAAWVACRGCGTLHYGKRLARNLGVCVDCGRHDRVNAEQRLRQLFDEGSVQALAPPVVPVDPLAFVDTRAYAERLRDAQEATGLDDAVVCVRATVDGQPVVAAVMDFRFLGGSLGVAVGELISQAAGVALAECVPLLLVTASGGARMQEGALALMQMARTSEALRELDDAGVLTVSLITDPTYGGVAASFATLPDVLVAEPGARLGFAGPRVIQQTIGQSLPGGFQTAEFLLAHGMVDVVQPRHELRSTIGKLLSVACRGRVAAVPAPAVQDAALVTDPADLPEREPWEVVRQARALERPTTLEYVALALDDFVELHGDRLGADCPTIVGGFAWLEGVPLVVIGHQKGHTAQDLSVRNFGMPVPSGYRKAARLMRLAAKLGLPVLTLVDTPGAHPGLEAEQQGQAFAIAESIRLMTGLPVPIVTVVTGEGGSGGALALAVANRVLALSSATYSVISPEGCAAILWRTAAEAPRAARALRVDARSLLAQRIVDGVIVEPDGGAQRAPQVAAARLRAAVQQALHELTALDPARLIQDRRARFRRFGAVQQ